MATSNKPVARQTVEFEGEEYSLAIIGKGRNVTREDKLDIASLVCKMYATDRHTLDQCLAHCGVKSSSSWFLWMDQIGEIESLYNEARRMKARINRVSLAERSRNALERAIDGHKVTLVTREAEQVLPTAILDENGNPVTPPEGMGAAMIVTKQKEREVYVRPSARLIEFALTNADSQNFRRNPDPDDDPDARVDIPPIEWVGKKRE